MDCSNSSFWKVDKFDMLFLVFILIITLSVVTFGAEPEEVETSSVSGLSFSENQNFYGSGSFTVYYFELEAGYIYHFTHSGTGSRFVLLSDNVPAVNVEYEILTYLPAGDQFDYLASSTSTLGFVGLDGSRFSVTREPLTDMNGAVITLTNDVGINQFWSIFELAIPFVAVVVLFVLGFFFVSKLMKKSSKGDIKF